MLDGEEAFVDGAASLGLAQRGWHAFFREAGDFELVEKVAEGVVLACYAEVEEFEALGSFAAVDTGALYRVEWLVIAGLWGGISGSPAHRAQCSIPKLQDGFR